MTLGWMHWQLHELLDRANGKRAMMIGLFLQGFQKVHVSLRPIGYLIPPEAQTTMPIALIWSTSMTSISIPMLVDGLGQPIDK